MRLITLALLLTFFNCEAQQENSYINYHQKCRLAEAFFIRENPDSCFLIYNQAFSEYKILFPRDCFMAAQIAHKSNHDSLAIEYLMKGIKFGLNPEFLLADSTYKALELTTSKYWAKITEQKDSLYRIYVDNIDWKMKNELMRLIRIDQNWRRRNNKWFNRTFRKGLEKKFDAINDQHVIYLDSIFKNTGYPGSWITGIGDSLHYQTNYASFNNANLSDLPSIVLYHNDSAFMKYGDFLFNEIKKGHIHPRTYALIRDFRDRHLVKKDKNEKMYYNIWWERDNYSIEEFKKHCHEIGCPTKQHLRDLDNKLGRGYDGFWFPFR